MRDALPPTVEVLVTPHSQSISHDRIDRGQRILSYVNTVSGPSNGLKQLPNRESREHAESHGGKRAKRRLLHVVDLTGLPIGRRGLAASKSTVLRIPLSKPMRHTQTEPDARSGYHYFACPRFRLLRPHEPMMRYRLMTRSWRWLLDMASCSCYSCSCYRSLNPSFSLH